MYTVREQSVYGNVEDIQSSLMRGAQWVQKHALNILLSNVLIFSVVDFVKPSQAQAATNNTVEEGTATLIIPDGFELELHARKSKTHNIDAIKALEISNKQNYAAELKPVQDCQKNVRFAGNCIDYKQLYTFLNQNGRLAITIKPDTSESGYDSLVIMSISSDEVYYSFTVKKGLYKAGDFMNINGNTINID